MTTLDDNLAIVRTAWTETVRTSTGAAARWLDLDQWPGSVHPQVAERLRRWALIAADLGDSDFASFLSLLASRDESEQTLAPQVGLLHVDGLDDRPWQLWANDELFPSLRQACVEVGKGDKSKTFEVSLRTNYVLLVETAATDPRLTIPVFLNDRLEISIRLAHPSFGESNELLREAAWVPEVVTRIGGDRLARNSIAQQEVRIGGFAVGVKPVTTSQFLRLRGDISAAQYNGVRLFDDDGHPTQDLPVAADAGWRNIPVVGLSLGDVQEFLGTLPRIKGAEWGLLSPVEWEAVFGGPENLIFPWGNLWVPDAANIRESGRTAVLEAAGSRELDSSRWGLRDGAGNTEEWTISEDGSPVGKGGSWYNDRQVSRSGSRVLRPHDYHHPKLGFRLVLRPLE